MPSAPRAPAGLVVVLVEDDDALRTVLTQTLERSGYQIFAYRTAEALNVGLFFRVRPAIAIVDTALPGNAGLKVCEMLAAARRVFGMKVLLTSNAEEAVLAEAAKAAGADGFVIKRKLLADPAGALRDLVAPPLVDAELIEGPTPDTPHVALARAVTRHLESYEPRVDVRVVCDVPVSALANGDRRFQATMTDLSIEGARLLVDSFSIAALNAPVQLAFTLEGLGNLEVNAKVAWKRPHGPDKKAATLGLRFDELPPRARELIEAYLGKTLAEFIKKQMTHTK